MLQFIYHRNSYLFSGIPQIYAAANRNKINNQQTSTYVFFYEPKLAKQSPIRKEK